MSVLAMALGVIGVSSAANAVDFSISGTVVGAAPGSMDGGYACTFPVGGGNGRCADFDSSGNYTITGVSAGSWQVAFNAPQDSDFVSEWYSDAANQASATPVVVSGNVTGINGVLSVGTSLAGVVLGSNGGVPVEGARVYAWLGASPVKVATTGANGTYLVRGLAPGDYKLQFYPPSSSLYIAEWWNDQPTSETAALVTVGTTPVTGFSATLTLGGGLSGNVKGSGAVNLSGAIANVYTSDGTPVYSTVTNSSGDWVVPALPPGTYSINIQGPSGGGYAAEWFDNKSSQELSNPVTISAGSTTTGLNAVLELAGSITGNVQNTVGANIQNVYVRAVGVDGHRSNYTTTDGSGNYTIAGLKPGDYTVEFDPLNASGGYARQWWNGATSPTSATSFAVASGATVSGRNAVLVAGSTISGYLTSATGAPLAGSVRVYFADGSAPGPGNFARFAYTTGDGTTYSITGLPVGTYRVGFTTEFSAAGLEGPLPSSAPYVSEWYASKYSFAGSTTVTITSPGQAVTGINGTLENPRFADVSDPASAFYPYIEWMASAGISTGTPQPTGKPLYKPLDSVSRQAMALFLYRLSGESFTPPATPTFADVTSTSHPQFYTAIEWMASRGISTGTPQPSGKPLYKPSDSVSRQAMALFLARYASASLSTPPTTQRFADVPLTASSAAAIEWMYSNGISTGTPQPPGLPLYKPADPVSRQAMAAFLSRVNDFLS